MYPTINTEQMVFYQSSEIRGLRSAKCSKETLQNLLYFKYQKTHIDFFSFGIYFNITFSFLSVETFHWNISLSANHIFLKIVILRNNRPRMAFYCVPTLSPDISYLFLPKIGQKRQNRRFLGISRSKSGDAVKIW